MNSWVGGLTQIFDSIAKNVTNVWTAVNVPSAGKVPGIPAAPQQTSTTGAGMFGGIPAQTLLIIAAAGVGVYFVARR